jgi:hypothetical protein
MQATFDQSVENGWSVPTNTYPSSSAQRKWLPVCILYEGGYFSSPRKAFMFWRRNGGLHEDGSRSRPRADPLALKEVSDLEFMIKNARRAISRDELLNEVWEYENLSLHPHPWTIASSGFDRDWRTIRLIPLI